MSQLVVRLFEIMGIKHLTVHDLRSSFATVVMVKSKDEFLTMNLIRDTVRGIARRYISYPIGQLVETLRKNSPSH